MALITDNSTHFNMNMLARVASAQRDAYQKACVWSPPAQECSRKSSTPEAKYDEEKEREEKVCSSPSQYMERLFSRNGVFTADMRRIASKPPPPSDEAIDAYDMEILSAVRRGDLLRVKQLHQDGKSLNACNRFGESLLHIACRRGYAELADYMINEANVSPEVCDDMGRTAFHDILWSPTVNTKTMDIMLRATSPDELLKKDMRGHTPFHYAPPKHWEAWLQYLRKRESYLLKWIRMKQRMMGPAE